MLEHAPQNKAQPAEVHADTGDPSRRPYARQVQVSF